MLKYLIPIYATISSRIHGGGIVQNVPRQGRNLLYALPYLVIVIVTGKHLDTHGFELAFFAFFIAFTGIDTGHYSFWYMGTKMPDQRSCAIGDVLREFKSLTYGSVTYCVIGMALKGAWIGIGTLDPLVIVTHALAWPAAYWIGMRIFPLRNDYAELLSGLFCGASLLLYGG